MAEMSAVRERLAALERRLQRDGCSTCRDWPPWHVTYEGEDPPRCASCGREPMNVIRIVYSDNWPTEAERIER